MCQGKTQKGEKCKKPTEPYCHLHEPKEFEFPVPVDHLPAKTQAKIKRRLQKPPSQSDGPGYIYIYTLPEDGPYYKVGRTERLVEHRIKEWKGAQLKKAYAVDYQKKMERLIHLYLDPSRVYRYQVAKGKVCTVWKSNGDPVTKYDAKLKEENKLEALSKQVEWFTGSFETIDTTMLMLINR